MNDSQLESCKEQLPPHAAREFERMQREATALLTDGWRLRRQAWDYYQEQKGSGSPAAAFPFP